MGVLIPTQLMLEKARIVLLSFYCHKKRFLVLKRIKIRAKAKEMLEIVDQSCYCKQRFFVFVVRFYNFKSLYSFWPPWYTSTIVT